LPWQYNSGDPPSTGATSMLYPFLLAVGILGGAAGENLAWFALSLGVDALILSAALISLITKQLLELTGPHKQDVVRAGPLLAALLFLLSGAVQWGYFNGMETGLFALLLLDQTALANWRSDLILISSSLSASTLIPFSQNFQSTQEINLRSEKWEYYL
jgi:hypothetical protein